MLAALSVVEMSYLVGKEQCKSRRRGGWIIEKIWFEVLIPKFKAHISRAAPAVQTASPRSRQAATARGRAL